MERTKGSFRFRNTPLILWNEQILLFCKANILLKFFVKHENYLRKIPYIGKKVRVWKIAYMKFTYTKFPTENILHIFWVWKIPYKKISYNNLEAYFCNWWTISPWKLTDIIWNWNIKWVWFPLLLLLL